MLLLLSNELFVDFDCSVSKNSQGLATATPEAEGSPECFLRQGLGAESGLEMFKEQFDWLYEESATSSRFMNIGLHPHVIGQPYRVRAIRDFIRYAKTFDDVWFATREEIAEWYLENHGDHIPAAS